MLPDSASINRFRNLLLITSVMVYLLIVIGGIVRVTGSGLGCPDWPRCFGQWIPPLRADAIIEYTHRLVATLTSPLILASAFVGWWRFRSATNVVRPLLASIFLLAAQGLLGGVVVLLETPPNLVAVHLGIAFLIQALVTVPAVIASQAGRVDLASVRLAFESRFARLVRLTAILMFLMILSGAFVVGSNSTYACSGWPLCNGNLLPAHPGGFVHMFHRLMVLLASIHIVFLYNRARSKDFSFPNLRPALNWLLVLFLAQAAVGALKVSTSFPVFLLGLHVALAAAVWAAMLILFTLAGMQTAKS